MWIKKTSKELQRDKNLARARMIFYGATAVLLWTGTLVWRHIPLYVSVAGSVLILLMILRRIRRRQTLKHIFVCDNCSVVKSTGSNNCTCGGHFQPLTTMKWEYSPPPSVPSDPASFSFKPLQMRG